jgi:hypothetical protein
MSPNALTIYSDEKVAWSRETDTQRLNLDPVDESVDPTRAWRTTRASGPDLDDDGLPLPDFNCDSLILAGIVARFALVPLSLPMVPLLTMRVGSFSLLPSYRTGSAGTLRPQVVVSDQSRARNEANYRFMSSSGSRVITLLTASSARWAYIRPIRARNSSTRPAGSSRPI